jgi:ssDNA-binding Zn-finger/Zn-ribbon topoisomerase 1
VKTRYRGDKSVRRLGNPNGAATKALPPVARLSMIAEADAARTEAAIADGHEQPECPKCSEFMPQPVFMVAKRAGNRLFWGCPRFPVCRGSKSMT